MSILQVANLQFESTGSNRIEYTGNNVVRVRANGGFQLPFGTTAQRAPGETGLMRYNTDTGLTESYGSAGWATLPDGSLVTGLYATSNAGYVVANAAFGAANLKVDTITSNSTSRLWANSVTVGSVETVYLDLAASGVTATTYGGATQIPVLGVDAYGRVTSASNVAVSGMDYAYVNTSTGAANNYAGVMANSANGYASTTYSTLTQLGQNWAVTNAAFGVANSALPKSGGTLTGTVSSPANAYLYIPHTGITNGWANTTYTALKFGSYGRLQHTSLSNVPFLSWNAELYRSDFSGSSSGGTANYNSFRPDYAAGYYGFMSSCNGGFGFNVGYWNNAANTDINDFSTHSSYAGGFDASKNWIVANGYVGVGTTTPSYQIDVRKTTNDAIIRTLTTGAGAYFYSDSGIDGFYGLRLQNSGTDKWFIGSYGTTSFQVMRNGPGGTPYLTVDSSGNFTSAGTITSSSRGITKASMPAGTVLQIQTTTLTTPFSSSTTGSFFDITGMSVSITPTSSTSTILVLVSGNAMGNQGTTGWGVRLVRNTTAICVGTSTSNRSPTSSMGPSPDNNWSVPFSITFLDSPATTSAVTYKLQGWVGTSSFTFNRSQSDTDTSGYLRSASTITVMEIAV